MLDMFAEKLSLAAKFGILLLQSDIRTVVAGPMLWSDILGERMHWAQRVAIVTGASTGIGRAVAREFSSRGVRVALVARSADKLETLARELGTERAASFPLDVTDRAALQALPACVKKLWGRLDFVVNNAGVNHRGATLERSPEELVAILETNLVAPVLLTRAALSLLEPDGVIVNVASLAGKVPVPDEAAYSASKAGVRAFARALNTELALHGRRIRVASVCPGPVDTGFLGEDLLLVPDLVFSQPMSVPEDISAAVVAVIEHGRQEQDVPALSGKLATLGYLSPRFFLAIRPVFEKWGAKKKLRFSRDRRRDGALSSDVPPVSASSAGTMTPDDSIGTMSASGAAWRRSSRRWIASYLS